MPHTEQKDTRMKPEDLQTDEAADTNKFLVFRLGGELFGARLLHIREVIKSQQIKTVPYMVSYFKGIINLRGQVISIIDLREKLGLKTDKKSTELILVLETNEGLIGTIIDDLVAVESYLPDEIDMPKNLESRIPEKFMYGIAKKGTLVNLIDIVGCLTIDDVRMVKMSKDSAA